MTMQIKNEGISHSLITQLDKVAWYNRQGSYRTRERYYKAVKRFCRFLAEEYHLQKLSNISPKHLNTYIQRLHSEGKSASSIKGKGGKVRSLPNNRSICIGLEKC